MYRTTPYTFGFVYVLSNPAMPGFIKVGHTDRTGEIRAEELYTTGVPLPFEVEFRAISSKAEDVEKEAHRLLDAHRPNPKREFFKVPANEAVKAVRDALQAANGIWSWTLETDVIHLRSSDRLAVTCREGELFTLIAYPKLMSQYPTALDVWQAPSGGDVVQFMGSRDPGYVAGLAPGILAPTRIPFHALTGPTIFRTCR